MRRSGHDRLDDPSRQLGLHPVVDVRASDELSNRWVAGHAALLRAARPTEVHLVLPASLEGAVQTRHARFFAPLGVSRLLLTRLDEALGFGVVLNVVERLNCRLSYWTTGQRVPSDIEEACGERVAELVLSA